MLKTAFSISAIETCRSASFYSNILIIEMPSKGATINNAYVINGADVDGLANAIKTLTK